MYEICDVCGWEDDFVQADDPDYVGGANGDISLNQAREQWLSTGKLTKRPEAPPIEKPKGTYDIERIMQKRLRKMRRKKKL